MNRDEEGEQSTGAAAKKESEALSVALHALLSAVDKSRLQEVGQRVGDLNLRLEALRKAVRAIPGVELSEQEQSERIVSLRTRIDAKNELINKYRTQGAAIFEDQGL